MNNETTHYKLNPDFYRWKYYKLKAKGDQDKLTGLLIGFAMSLLMYTLILCGRQ